MKLSQIHRNGAKHCKIIERRQIFVFSFFLVYFEPYLFHRWERFVGFEKCKDRVYTKPSL